MLTPPTGEGLASKRYLSVILRLLLRGRGKLEYGEITGPSDGEPDRVRFSTWQELSPSVRRWVKQHQPEDGN